MTLKGVISTPMTPFDGNENIDPSRIPDHMAWAAQQGLDGVFVLGTWGGFPLLSFDERKAVGEAYIDSCRRENLSCTVNIGTPCVKEAEYLARHAEDKGATAVASLIPYYHASGGYYTLDHYRRYFDRLLKATDLPLFLYNNPRTTGILLSPAEFTVLAADGLAGVKDGSKDVGWIMSTQAMLKEKGLKVDIVPGNTTAMLYSHLYGLPAITSGAAVTFPKLATDIFDSLKREAFGDARRLHALLMEARRVISRYGNPAQATYSALTAMKKPDLGLPRIPWLPLDSAKATDLVKELEAIDGIDEYL